MLRTLFLAAFIGLLWTASAVGQSFTFTTENSQTTITGFSSPPSGAVTVPATLGGFPVVAIGRSAFKDQTAITSIAFAAPASVLRIGATAFQGCTALQSVTLPTGITTVSPGLLQGCVNLTSVSIPAGVASVGAAAFAECRSLPSLSLPAGLTSLGDSAFSNCRSLLALTVPSGVTAIPGQLFRECRALASVSLPAGVTSIGYAAFYNCSALGSFALPAGVTTVARDAFQGCGGLASLAINGALASLGDRVLLGTRALAAITVDAANPTYSSVDGVLFNKAQTILLLYPEAKSGSYTVPSSVMAIGPAAFAHCTALANVTVPASVLSLGADAFYYATGLTRLTLNEGLAAIGTWAVAGCSALSGVTIPASVASIGSDALHYDRALGYALFRGNAPTMGANVFDSAAAGFTVYYFAAQGGFTSPTWLGYPAVALTAPPAFVSFLTQNGYSPGASPAADLGGSGVTLLQAYALGLNPAANLAASLPDAVLANGFLSITFYGSGAGINYSVQTSADLQNWTTTGVTLTAPDAGGSRTGYVAADAPDRFLRLVVGF